MEKDDFIQYKFRALEVQQLRAQLQALESSIYSPRGQRYTSTPSSSSWTGPSMADVVDRHVKLEEKYRKALAEKEAQQLAVETAIQSLEDSAERLVMRTRYIEGLPWWQVVAKLSQVGLSERTIYRLHGFALLKLKGEQGHE